MPIATASRRLLPVLTLLPLGACGDPGPDAWGNFEAREVVVSAETSGRLVRFDVAEGDQVVAGAVVAQVDTTPLVLQRRELLSRESSTRTRTAEAEAQIGVLRAQLAVARAEHERTLRLHRAEAATTQQLERAAGEVRVLEERIRAARAQAAAAREEVDGVGARVEQIVEQLARSRISNPIAGTVLATWVEAGELAQPGMPLYAIADLDTLDLRAWITGDQLARVRIGQEVRVRVEGGGGEGLERPGRVTWIASRAEFTPTPVQTRDEHASQVYAVRIRVPNPDGALKVGMPAEVFFTASTAEQASAEGGAAGLSRP